MEQEQFIIDTNSVIDYLGNKLPKTGMNFMNGVIDEVPLISVITKIEVLGFSAPSEHYKLLQDFINDSNVLNLSEQIVNHCIELRKSRKTKLPDVIIAATALTLNLTVISRNTKDFKNITGLKVIDPHNL
jgi:predicted nucleic acid-binding protein